MKIGLLGGSFNPVHHGHLLIAACAAESAGLDRVLLIPTAISPLKERGGLASAEDRLAMVRLAVRRHPRLEASDLEVRRGGVSYTIDTLRTLGRKAGAKLHLILGEDAVRLLPRWKESAEVRRLATLLVAGRPAAGASATLPGNALRVQAPRIEISSTEIRRRVSRGLTLRYWVPESVERYIRRKGLYR